MNVKMLITSRKFIERVGNVEEVTVSLKQLNITWSIKLFFYKAIKREDNYAKEIQELLKIGMDD